MKQHHKNYAFIDSQNLNLAIRGLGWSLDFQKFRKYLEDKYQIAKAFLFIGYVPENQALYTSLQKYGYILVFKPTLKLPHGGVDYSAPKFPLITVESLERYRWKLSAEQAGVKGNVDAELVLHAMIEYQHYDKALIVTGDDDFYCLVSYLIKQEKLLKLMIPDKKHYSSLYRRLMSHIVFMNALKNKTKYIK